MPKIVSWAAGQYQNAMADSVPDTAYGPTAAVIVAAGRGTRMGGEIPKQFMRLGGETVLTRTLRVFAAHPAIAALVIVTHPEDAAAVSAALPQTSLPLQVVPGGATRDASVAAGLAAVPDTMQHVLIHDAARPLVPTAVIDGVLEALKTHDGAAPALAVTDALWRGGDIVTGTEDRAGLWRAQTPQGFRLSAIRAAHAAHPGGAADDVEVARAFGIAVAITPGDARNLKLTTPADMTRAETYLNAAHPKEDPMDIRTGNGFDVHRFGPGDHVMLCGLAIPHGRGLQGHSDADVALHTVTDAIYGALAEGDIGQHFPPSDPQWKGAESHIFLSHAVDLAASKGFRLTHADLTLICEYPKIGPHVPEMRRQLAALLKVELARVSVKATTSERLGFTGREEGIAALATVTLVSP